MKQTLIEVRGMNSSEVWDYENGYYWFAHSSRMGKLFAHYELYKKIQNLPGHIVEFGVYKAASLIRWLTMRELLENQFSRRVIGFDAFGKFPTKQVSLHDDLNFIDSFEDAGGDGLSVDESQLILDSKGFLNYSLVQGNIFDTLPSFLASNPELRVALLHLDMDVMEPTAFAIQSLYDRVVPGGIIVIDDYNSVKGATLAIDEFILGKGLMLSKLSYYNVPAFIQKPF